MGAPTAPNTIAVLDEFQAQAQALKLADGVTLTYQTVVIGAQKDYTDIALPCLTLIPRHDESQRHAHGGIIVEPMDIEFRSIVDTTISNTASQAEVQIIAIRDALMPLLQKYAVTPNTLTVYHSQVKKGSAAFSWMFLKPNWYRIHTVLYEVAQYYVVPGGIQ